MTAPKRVVLASPRGTARVLAAAIVCLVALSLLGTFSTHVLGHGYLKGFVPLFNLDAEGNVPTWFSASLLLFCAGLLMAAAAAAKAAGEPYVAHWRVLSLGFVYLSVDEASAIHELSQRPLRSGLETGGFLHFAWVIPATLILVAIAFAFRGFVAHLSPKTRKRFLWAAALYVGGGLGVEMIGGHFITTYGHENIGYGLITTAEEALELAGLALFVFALMSHLQRDSETGFAIGSR